ncbi:MAG: hypothetical protein ACRD19_04015, partial [Terriglobia bacterium]
RQLRQRITLRSKTYPLTPAETEGYIHSRLRIAGSEGQPIFAPEAIEALHQYSRGIPRMVNILCEHSLINAFADQRRPVTAQIVAAVARDFELQTTEPSPPPEAVTPDGNGAPLEDALQGLTALMDRLRRAE